MHNKFTFQFKIDKNFCLALLFFLIWSRETLYSYIVAVISRLPIIGPFSNYLYPIMVGILVIATISVWRITRKDIYFIFLLIAAFICSFFVSSENAPYLEDNIRMVFVSSVPMIFIMRTLDFEKKIWKKRVVDWFYLLSVAITLTSGAYMFYSKHINALVLYDNSSMANIVLMSLVIVLTNALLKPDALSIVTSVFGSLMLLTYGARGACVGLLSYLLLHLIFNTKKRITWLVVLVIAAMVFYQMGWFEMTLTYFENTLNNMGLSTRVFDFLHTGSSNWDSDIERQRLYATITNAIKDRPFVGYGILGDRAIIGGWAHNIVLELWIDFGVIIGTVVFIGIILHIVNGIRYTQVNSYQRGIVLAFVSGTMVIFFFSGSLWVSKYFFMLLGLCSRYRCYGVEEIPNENTVVM